MTTPRRGVCPSCGGQLFATHEIHTAECMATRWGRFERMVQDAEREIRAVLCGGSSTRRIPGEPAE